MKDIIVFKLDNCSPCTQLTEKMKTLDLSEFNVQHVLASDNLPLFKKHRVSGAPTVIIFDGDKQISRATGYESSLEVLKEAINGTT